MADKAISGLTEANSVGSTDWAEIETAAGNSRKVKNLYMQTVADAAFNKATQAAAADNRYVPGSSLSAPSSSASDSGNLRVTFTLDATRTVLIEFFAIFSRSANQFRAYVTNSSGTKVWPKYPQSPDAADGNAPHTAIYSRNNTNAADGSGNVLSFAGAVSLAAGTHTLVVFVAHSGGTEATEWYDRMLRVTY